MAAVEPLLKPFETAAPPANYKKLDASLEAFMKVHVPVEKEAGLRTRERVLGELKRIFQDWVRQVCRAKGLSDDLAAYVVALFAQRVEKGEEVPEELEPWMRDAMAIARDEGVGSMVTEAVR